MYKYEHLGLERIDPNELKVGDVIAVARDQSVAWSNLPYPSVTKETITRITPKRTKIVTDVTEYEVKAHTLYRWTNRAQELQIVGNNAKSIVDFIYELHQHKADIMRNLSETEIKDIWYTLSTIKTITDKIKDL